MIKIGLVYPHQLFFNNPAVKNVDRVVLIEDPLFFKQFPFHKQKLLFHRLSMREYLIYLQNLGLNVDYLDSVSLNDSRDIESYLIGQKVEVLRVVDVHDNWLELRLRKLVKKLDLKLEVLESPNFITPTTWGIEKFSQQRGVALMHNFYVAQRDRLKILMDGKRPVGQQWSFDQENRKRLPKDSILPHHFYKSSSTELKSAIHYVEKHYPLNPGKLDNFNYPTNHSEAREALKIFIEYRLKLFGPFQDAIDRNDSRLFHSVLSPSINSGLINPNDIIEAVLAAAENTEIPLSSLEGFIRQIIGWREFVLLSYKVIGTRQRNANFFKCDRKLPDSFWTGSTGIDPIDDVIGRVLDTAYANHIERLMVLSNFMLLCEFEPNSVYDWFMSLFIDAYDWVMVPNVYGMSLYADGGMITTKPYISSSNYICKMSHYQKGEWADVWDSLYWNFIQKHKNVFEKNVRSKMVVKNLERIDHVKRMEQLNRAKDFLGALEYN